MGLSKSWCVSVQSTSVCLVERHERKSSTCCLASNTFDKSLHCHSREAPEPLHQTHPPFGDQRNEFAARPRRTRTRACERAHDCAVAACGRRCLRGPAWPRWCSARLVKEHTLSPFFLCVVVAWSFLQGSRGTPLMSFSGHPPVCIVRSRRQAPLERSQFRPCRPEQRGFRLLQIVRARCRKPDRGANVRCICSTWSHTVCRRWEDEHDHVANRTDFPTVAVVRSLARGHNMTGNNISREQECCQFSHLSDPA